MGRIKNIKHTLSHTNSTLPRNTERFQLHPPPRRRRRQRLTRYRRTVVIRQPHCRPIADTSPPAQAILFSFPLFSRSIVFIVLFPSHCFRFICFPSCSFIVSLCFLFLPFAFFPFPCFTFLRCPFMSSVSIQYQGFPFVF